MTAPTQTVLPVNVATLQDSAPLTPDADTVGCNAVWHVVTAGDNTNHMIFPNTERETIHIQSTDAAEVIVTIYSNACDQEFTTEHNVIADVYEGNSTPQVKILGPFANARWGATYGTLTDAVNNYVRFKCGTDTTVKVMIVQTPASGY